MKPNTQHNSGASFDAATQRSLSYYYLDDDGISRLTGCTCESISEYNSEDPIYDRHEPECALSPNLDGWLWYPHDGELENGGVYVNPADTSWIYLLVKGYLCPVPCINNPEVNPGYLEED